MRGPEALVALLGAGLQRDLGGGLGARVEGQGLFFQTRRTLSPYVFSISLERRLDAPAERALEVGELDDA